MWRWSPKVIISHFLSAFPFYFFLVSLKKDAVASSMEGFIVYSYVEPFVM